VEESALPAVSVRQAKLVSFTALKEGGPQLLVRRLPCFGVLAMHSSRVVLIGLATIHYQALRMSEILKHCCDQEFDQMKHYQ